MSSKRNRKSLDDALAQQFIYGEEQQETPKEPAIEDPDSETQPQQPTLNSNESLAALLTAGTRLGMKQKPQKKPSAITKFQAPPKEPTVRFTVDLSQSMHQKLSLLAAITGKKKAEIVRMLLDEVLKDIDT